MKKICIFFSKKLHAIEVALLGSFNILNILCYMVGNKIKNYDYWTSLDR